MSDFGPVCSVPGCEFNASRVSDREQCVRAIDRRTGEEFEVRRHAYRGADGAMLFLCDTCHSAVKFVEGRKA